MADIAVRKSDSAVIGDGASFNGNGLLICNGSVMSKFTSANVDIHQGVAALPDPFVPFKSHTWSGSAYVETGYTPPAAPGLWGNKAAIPPDDFPATVVNALTAYFVTTGATAGDQAASLVKAADEFDRMWNDKRSAWVRATINAPTMAWLDPNDKPGNFQKMITYMKTTPAQADAEPIMKTGYEAAISAGWPDV